MHHGTLTDAGLAATIMASHQAKEKQPMNEITSYQDIEKLHMVASCRLWAPMQMANASSYHSGGQRPMEQPCQNSNHASTVISPEATIVSCLSANLASSSQFRASLTSLCNRSVSPRPVLAQEERCRDPDVPVPAPNTKAAQPHRKQVPCPPHAVLPHNSA